MSTSGIIAIGAVVTSPGVPVAKACALAAGADRGDEVEDAQNVPGREETARGELRAAVKSEHHEWCGHGNSDIAEPRRPGEGTGQDAVGVEREEAESHETPRLDRRQESRVRGQSEVVEGGPEAIRREEDEDRRYDT